MLPYPVRYAAAGLRQIGPSLEAAARVSGAGLAMTIRRIVMPMIAPPLAVAMLLVFAIASRELVASVMLAPPGLQTVSTYVFNQFVQGSAGEGMSYALELLAGEREVFVHVPLAQRNVAGDDREIGRRRSKPGERRFPIVVEESTASTEMKVRDLNELQRKPPQQRW